MEFKILVAGISMILLVGCCASKTLRNGPATPVHVKANSVSRSQPLLDITHDSSLADIMSNEISGNDKSSRHSDSETKHKMHEEKEGKLLDDGVAKNLTESMSEELVTDGLPDDNETSVVQTLDGIADEERDGSSVTALYTLYSLISYVASVSEEYNAQTNSKESAATHISSLYILYSLVSYVAHSTDLKELNNEENDNTNQTSAGVSSAQGLLALFSSLHQEWDKNFSRGSKPYNPWTGYLIIAVSVVAAIALIIVAVTCVTRHCRRTSTQTAGNRVLVRVVGSPTI